MYLLHALANGSTEGDDTGYGQALFPVPAEDPNDPFQVRLKRSVKHEVAMGLTFRTVGKLQEDHDIGHLLVVFILGQLFSSWSSGISRHIFRRIRYQCSNCIWTYFVP